jgi:glyoxylase-like metal-dependent hydrolase (beta-lactamase superfamily II)
MVMKRIGDVVLIQLSDTDSNIYMAGDTIIDSGTGFNFTRLYTIMKILKKGFDDIKQVINTHAHFDHVGGNAYFLNAKILIHELGASVLETGDIKRSWADFFDGKLKPRKVDIKLKENDKVNVNEMELEVIHTPGHTPDSICLLDKKQGILFSGDTIFADGVGRTDLIGGDTDALGKSLEKISKLDIQKILPGHGEPVLENAKKVLEDILKS